jgi:hypothetical protein
MSERHGYQVIAVTGGNGYLAEMAARSYRCHPAVRNRTKISKGVSMCLTSLKNSPQGDGGLCPPINFGSVNRIGRRAENFWVYGSFEIVNQARTQCLQALLSFSRFAPGLQKYK